MEIPAVGIFMDKKEQETYDAWTKEQVYEAYIVSVEANQLLNKEINRLNRKLAEIRFLAK